MILGRVTLGAPWSSMFFVVEIRTGNEYCSVPKLDEMDES